jgi:hypothetical protein
MAGTVRAAAINKLKVDRMRVIDTPVIVASQFHARNLQDLRLDSNAHPQLPLSSASAWLGGGIPSRTFRY